MDLKEKTLTDNEKDVLCNILDEIFRACFSKEVRDCKNYHELKSLLMRHGESIAERLGVDIEKESEIDDLNSEIYDLEEKVDELETELSELKCQNLIEEWKQEIVQKYIDKFSPLELEEIFANN